MQAFLYQDTQGNEAIVMVNDYDAEFVGHQMELNFRKSWWKESDKGEATPIEPDSFVITAGMYAHRSGAHDLFCELK